MISLCRQKYAIAEMTNNLDDKKEWLKSHFPLFAGTFFLGIITTIVFGQIIPISIFPDNIQKLLSELRHTPSISGWYYYITETDLNKSPIKVICNNDKETTKIAGVVEISHIKNISESNISFLNGEREYCFSKESKPIELNPHLRWNSDWAVFQNMKIYAYLNVKNDLHSLLNAEISSNLSTEHFSFSGPLVYIPQPQLGLSPFYTTIEFTKCKSKDDCENQLRSKLGFKLVAS